ncbi:hypothetical protein ABZZ79_12735 [Streptomyces sp. NPDC006458]|uniref:SCO2102 family sporulation regulator n=1 Tax=Streptomyces sp. NPDC006458 TaxID=3154302 RepID=UPI0033A0BF00
MGWTVLYIAFGVVALWLLGEVLLQYKARLRWRLLAFAGFLGVVAGVLISSVVVIGLGACAFALGQVYVTMSFRRGFKSGWAVNRPGADRDRDDEYQDPTLEVSDLEETDRGAAADHRRAESGYAQDDDYDHDDVFTPTRTPEPAAAETTDVYQPQPLPEDTGSYGVYRDGYTQPAQPQDQYAATAQSTDQGYGYDAYSGYGQQQTYGYDATGEQQYAAYSDPYIGTQSYGGASYDTSYGGQQQYGQQAYGQDQYATGGYGESTPADGVWVPQQRTDEQYGTDLPQDQGYPYQGGDGQSQGTGYDEHYRY